MPRCSSVSRILLSTAISVLSISSMSSATPQYFGEPGSKTRNREHRTDFQATQELSIPSVPMQPRFPGLLQLQQPIRAIVRHAASPLAAVRAEASERRLRNVPQQIQSQQLVLRQERQVLADKLSQLRIQPTTVRSFSLLANVSVLDGVTQQQIEKLASEGIDVRAERHFYPTLDQSVPLIEAPQVWEQVDSNGQPSTGHGVNIAVIDTGVDYTHPDFGSCTRQQFLAGQCERVRGGYDFVDDDNDPIDEQDHGTHVAGIIGGNGAVRGVAPDVNIYSYRVCGDSSCSESAMLAAFERVVDPNQDGNPSDHHAAANVSIGGAGDPDDILSQAADLASRSGVVMVIAAGNSGPGDSSIDSPGCARKALTVGATFGRSAQGTYWGMQDPAQDEITPFSSRGPVVWGSPTNAIQKPDIVAPGGLICAARRRFEQRSNYPTCIDGDHWSLSGTSMATPHIVGVVALMLQARPTLTPDQVRAIIKSTAEPIYDPRSNGTLYPQSVQGAGRVNAQRAVFSTEIPVSEREFIITTRGERTGHYIPIHATASGPGFQSYSFEYRVVGEQQWRPLGQGTAPVVNGLVGTIDTAGIPDGGVEIRGTGLFSGITLSDAVQITIQNIKILYPPARENNAYQLYPVFVPEEVEVKGSVNTSNLEHFELYVCGRASNQSSCRQLPLLVSDSQPVTNAVLGRFSTVGLPSGRNAVVILSYDRSGNMITDINEFLLDARADPRFTHISSFATSDRTRYNSLAVMRDVTGDGVKELIFVDCDTVHVVDKNGVELPGFPKHVPESELFCGIVEAAVTDLNEDGIEDIVVNRATLTEGEILAFQGDGSRLRYQNDFAYQRGGSRSRFGQIVPGGWKEEVSIVAPWLIVTDADSSYVQGWRRRLYDGGSVIFFFGSANELRVADIDADGTDEVFNVAVSFDPDRTNAEEYLMVVNAFNSNGSLPGYPKQIPTALSYSHAVVADLAGNGQKALITSHLEPVGDGLYQSVIHAFTAQGNELPGWPVRLDADPDGIIGKMYAADIDQNGSVEVIVMTGNEGAIDRCLYMFSANGQEYPNTRWCGQRQFLPDPLVAVANTSQGGALELLGSGYSTLGHRALVTYQTEGASRYVSEIPFGDPRRSAVGFDLGDFDEDGVNELVINTDRAVRLYRLSSCVNQSGEWNQSGGFRPNKDLMSSQSRGPCQVNGQQPPRIIQQPVAEWGRRHMSTYPTTVVVESESPVSYQWQMLDGGRWRDIVGAREHQLYPGNLGLSQLRLRVVVSNQWGSTISDATEYQNYFLISYRSRPTVTIRRDGSRAKFSAYAEGAGELRYIWERATHQTNAPWQEVITTTQNEVELPLSSGSYRYRVSVTNGEGLLERDPEIIDQSDIRPNSGARCWIHSPNCTRRVKERAVCRFTLRNRIGLNSRAKFQLYREESGNRRTVIGTARVGRMLQFRVRNSQTLRATVNGRCSTERFRINTYR